MLTLLRDYLRNKAPTTPGAPLPVERRTLADYRSPPATGLRVTWLGHSTSIVELDGRRFLIDPVWADRTSPIPKFGPKRFFAPPLALGEVPPVDAVFLSHDHYDHLDRRTIALLALRGTQFIAPLGVGERLVRWGVPRNQVTELDWWQKVDVGGVTITATPARHFSGRSPIMLDRNRTLWAGYALTGPQHRVYYSGDTAMFDGFDEIGETLGPFDATLMEIGAYHRHWADVHLGPEQAIEAVQRVRGGVLIPLHWATFDLAMHGWTEPIERLLVAASRTGTRVVALKPGQRVEPASLPAFERWWPSLPWDTAQQHPIVSSGLAPTPTPTDSA